MSTTPGAESHPVRPGIDAIVDQLEAQFSAEHEMLCTRLERRNYHSTLAVGRSAHEVRASLDYAILLLQRGGDERIARAQRIIARVLSLQVTDPCEPTYGIWPYYLEEPVASMAPPDWNWADFCGARLALMLKAQADSLESGLKQAMRKALGHAAWAIFRRNVQPGYTNIAVMGAVVTALAGELLDESRLLAYGRRRLQRVFDHASRTGGFSEYNSPTYTIVTVLEAERALQLSDDRAVREAAEGLRQLAWRAIAEHFHPPTQQWAGPHARAYCDRLLPATVSWLNDRLPAPLPVHPRCGGPTYSLLETGIEPRPCPEQFTRRFARLDPPQQEHRHRYGGDGHGRAAITTTTWLGPASTLASADRGELWNQRRPLIGYFNTAADPAAVLRVRLLKDGEDFASGYLRCAQHCNRVLGLVTLLCDGGDFHLHLDRPADGSFDARDLRLRLELIGEDVSVDATATPLDASRYCLSAPPWRAVIHLPADGPAMLGRSPRWQVQALGDRVVLDAVWWSDQPVRFNPGTEQRPCWQPFALELLEDQQPPAQAPLELTVAATENRVAVIWAIKTPLALEAPMTPHPRP